MLWVSQVEQMRQADKTAIDELKIPGILLMEAAARGICARLMKLCLPDDDILFLCGPGGNGGDGFAAARMMKQAGYDARVYFTGDVSHLSGDARTNFEMLQAYSVPVVSMDQGALFNHIAGESEWVVDALFGSGLNREIMGLPAQMVRTTNELRRKGKFKVLSVDIPSGIAGDTGKVMGEAVEADETITFGRLKPGLLLYPGRDYAGHVTIWDVGVPSSVPALSQSRSFVLEKKDVASMLPYRPSHSHKGMFGRLLSLSGSASMPGAAAFSAMSAYRIGTGLVDVMVPFEVASVLQSLVPEAITFPYDTQGDSFDFIVSRADLCDAAIAGPGLSTAPYAEKMLGLLITSLPRECPLLLDADGLNLLSSSEEIKQALLARAQNGGVNVLTPHLGEASRLLKEKVTTIQADPVSASRRIAKAYQSVVVLKDALTLITEPSGRLCFNTTGNNGMSTAGSGDVLSGMIGGLLAQGMAGFDAACAGVFLHGAAGDLARGKRGSISMTARDILDGIRPEEILQEQAKDHGTETGK